MTIEPEKAVIWRVTYREGNAHGGGCGGEVVYYEASNLDRMEEDILEALLNGDCGDGFQHSRPNLLSKILRHHRSPELDKDSYKWRRYKVVEVAYLDNGEWTPMNVDWTPPAVVFTPIEVEQHNG